MRTRFLVGAAASLICLLALLNLVAEHLHWQRGGFRHPRAELLHQTELRLQTRASAPAAPPPPLTTAAGALGSACNSSGRGHEAVRCTLCWSRQLAAVAGRCLAVLQLLTCGGLLCRGQHHTQTAQQVPCGRHGGRLGVHAVAGPRVLLPLQEVEEGIARQRRGWLHPPAPQVSRPSLRPRHVEVQHAQLQ